MGRDDPHSPKHITPAILYLSQPPSISHHDVTHPKSKQDPSRQCCQGLMWCPPSLSSFQDASLGLILFTSPLLPEPSYSRLSCVPLPVCILPPTPTSLDSGALRKAVLPGTIVLKPLGRCILGTCCGAPLGLVNRKTDSADWRWVGPEVLCFPQDSREECPHSVH